MMRLPRGSWVSSVCAGVPYPAVLVEGAVRCPLRKVPRLGASSRRQWVPRMPGRWRSATTLRFAWPARPACISWRCAAGGRDRGRVTGQREPVYWAGRLKVESSGSPEQKRAYEGRAHHGRRKCRSTDWGEWIDRTKARPSETSAVTWRKHFTTVLWLKHERG